MGILQQISKAFQSIRELGLEKVSLFGLYQFALKTGFFQLATPIRHKGFRDSGFGGTSEDIQSSFPILPVHKIRQLIIHYADEEKCLEEAQTIILGNFHRYGGNSAPIDLSNSTPGIHWSKIRDDLPDRDIKDTWEPARFGWVFTLARAYVLTGDEQYPQTFMHYFHEFRSQNPPNSGAHWVSAQEVALRIIAFVFAWQVFQKCPCFDETFVEQLSQSIAEHAQRIPPTLLYARSQNNNHLISEAVGLYTAGVFLHPHPAAEKWKRLGSHWFHRALQMQIFPDGAYVQHSMNYHRLMLQLSLWYFSISHAMKDDFPHTSKDLLGKSAQWMIDQVDPISGNAPNLGHNDGSNLLPISPRNQSDYRPIAQAASRAFCGKPCYGPGIWDELSLWLELDNIQENHDSARENLTQVLKLGTPQSWATLRAVQFVDRPAHADQLHVDLWYRGCNIARDAGTYRYTASAPWQNALAGTAVHNTVTVNQADQMQRAGRFLWLKWAQAHVLSRSENEICAQHYGYAMIGAIHQRTLNYVDDQNWSIIDSILSADRSIQKTTATLQWLLPDLPWELNQNTLILHHAQFDCHLTLQIDNLNAELSTPPTFQLVRAGEVLYGQGAVPEVAGWFSGTYGEKVPALSFSVTIQARPPYKIISKWYFIDTQ